MAGIQRRSEAVGNTPQKFAQEIRDETTKWAKVIKDAGMKSQ